MGWRISAVFKNKKPEWLFIGCMAFKEEITEITRN